MAGNQFYKMEPITDGNQLTDKYDYFFLAGGSDFRAYEVLRKCKRNGTSIKTVVAFSYDERVKELNEDECEKYFDYEKQGYDTIKIKCPIMDPSKCLKSSNFQQLEIRPESKIIIDISVFTKPYFFSLIKFLKDEIGMPSLTIVYTEPMSYSFDKGSYQQSFHSTKGPLSVMEIPGYPGSDKDTKGRTLVLLLGFDGELSSFIYDEVAPDEVAIINGFPGYSSIFKDISIINNEKIVSNKKLPISYARANNPFETYNVLEDIKIKRPNSFINIAPLGPKPMALGACLFSIMDPTVRVLYPLPEKYENKTSDECYTSWSYLIPLSC